jgi:hypothetical protein
MGPGGPLRFYALSKFRSALGSLPALPIFRCPTEGEFRVPVPVPEGVYRGNMGIGNRTRTDPWCRRIFQVARFPHSWLVFLLFLWAFASLIRCQAVKNSLGLNFCVNLHVPKIKEPNSLRSGGDRGYKLQQSEQAQILVRAESFAE